jgi:hypothetical protein
VKRIGVLTSGGDAPGMNAGILAAVKVAMASGTNQRNRAGRRTGRHHARIQSFPSLP